MWRAVILLAVGAAAQTGAAPQTGTAIIRGRVIADGLDVRSPIPNARVSIGGGPDRDPVFIVR